MGEEGERGREISPVMATLAAAFLGLAFNIIYNLAYQPSRRDIDDLQERVSKLEADPHPKPETKIALSAIDQRIAGFEARQNRMEDRLNNLHFFLLQSQPKQPPLRRGDIPAFEPPKL